MYNITVEWFMSINFASFGTWAMIVQIVTILFGMPDQIRILNRVKESDQISLVKQMLILTSCLFWLGYAYEIGNWIIGAPQFLTVPMMIVIVSQIIYYRRFKVTLIYRQKSERTHLTAK